MKDAANNIVLDYDYYPNGSAPPGASGRVKAIKAASGVDLGFEYDGPLMTKAAWSGNAWGSQAKNVSWTYNPEFLQDSESVAGSSTIKLGYDRDGLLTCASPTACAPTPAADALKITYKDAGMPKQIQLGSTAEGWVYNSNGEIGYQQFKFGTLDLLRIIYDDAVIPPTVLPRDPLGRIRRRLEVVQPVLGYTYINFQYSYDERGQLLSVKRDGTVIEQYAYDSNGNRLSHTPGNTTQTDFVDAQDRWDQTRTTNYGNIFYGVSANGEVISKQVKTPSPGPITNYTYDFFGNLTGVSVAGGSTISYVVDGMNRRVGKKVNGNIVKRWLYRDRLRPVAELDGAGALVARFVYGARPNVPDVVMRDGKTYRIVSDQVGSPRLAVDVNDGTVVYRAEYSAFGVQTMITGNADWIPFGFAGGLYDGDTGLVRFGAREYEPFTGRWMQKDPIRFGGDGANLYAYANNDPINFMDPNGEFAILLAPPVILAAAAAAAVGALECLLNPAACKAIVAAFKNACEYNPPNDPPHDCDKEWREAYETCAELMVSKQTPEVKRMRGSSGGVPYDVEDCAKGYVSEACGGNEI